MIFRPLCCAFHGKLIMVRHYRRKVLGGKIDWSAEMINSVQFEDDKIAQRGRCWLGCNHYNILIGVPDLWHFCTDPDPYLWLTDPDLGLFVNDPQDINKKSIYLVLAYYFSEVHLHHSSKIKKNHNIRSKVFFRTIFAWFGSVPLTNGSGRSKNRRFRNTGFDAVSHADPTLQLVQVYTKC